MTSTNSARGACAERYRAGNELILSVARVQHGVVARRQLLEHGFSGSSIDRRIASSRLLPVFPGVFALGADVLSDEGWWMAGVLVSGPGAVLSHTTAGALWGISDPGPRIEVTRSFSLAPEIGLAPGCRIPRLRIRRTRSLPATEMTDRSGIPVMSIERTLLSLASVLTPRQLESAYLHAVRSGALDQRSLGLVLRRGPGWKGIGTLRRLASQEGASDPRTKSVLEDRFLVLCRNAGIRKPKVNRKVEGMEVDCCWPAERLIVELDGFRYHSDPHSFRRDRDRDARLELKGYHVVRFTYQQVTEEPDLVAGVVAGLLSNRSRG
jgi:very-short-patch-repair endonuclease